MDTKNTPKNLKQNLPIIIAVAVMVLLGGAGIWFFTKPNPAPTPASTISLPSSTTPTTADAPENRAPSLVATDSNPLAVTSNAGNTAPISNQSTTTPTAPTTTPRSKYKDGSYTADGSYVSPAGTEGIGVKATILNGKIAEIAVTSKATNSKSVRYQGFFKDGISGVIVGKSLDQSLDPGDVNGSSLTGSGFVQAMDAIKLLAQK